MGTIKEFFKSLHIQIALATGFSIIIMAYFSKRILPEPLGYLQLAIPPFIATIFESLLGKYNNSKFLTPWYWTTAVLISTAIIILLNF
jgi:hypothetical protein